MSERRSWVMGDRLLAVDVGLKFYDTPNCNSQKSAGLRVDESQAQCPFVNCLKDSSELAVSAYESDTR